MDGCVHFDGCLLRSNMQSEICFLFTRFGFCETKMKARTLSPNHEAACSRLVQRSFTFVFVAHGRTQSGQLSPCTKIDVRSISFLLSVILLPVETLKSDLTTVSSHLVIEHRFRMPTVVSRRIQTRLFRNVNSTLRY